MTDTPRWPYTIREDDVDWEGHINAPSAQDALDEAFSQVAEEITQPEDITLEARYGLSCTTATRSVTPAKKELSP